MLAGEHATAARVLLLLLLVAGACLVEACPSGCHCSGRVVNCRGAGLTAVPHVGDGPQDIPRDTQHLDLSENSISSIPGRAFAKLQHAKFINLQSNHISELVSDAFVGLSSVSRLYLSYNEIAVIEQDTFAYLHSLSDLSMLGNPSQCDADGDCDCQQGLIAGRGYCVVYSEDCDEPVQEEEQHACPLDCKCTREQGAVLVDCYDRGLRKFPANIPTDVTDLDLGSNAINDLWGQLTQFTELRELRLEDNLLSTLRAADFAALKNLRYLSLDENEIRFVDRGVFSGLNNLQRVIMSENPTQCQFRDGLMECICAAGLTGDGSFCAIPRAMVQAPARENNNSQQGKERRNVTEESDAAGSGWSLTSKALAGGALLLVGAVVFLLARRRQGAAASYDMPLYYNQRASW